MAPVTVILLIWYYITLLCHQTPMISAQLFDTVTQKSNKHKLCPLLFIQINMWSTSLNLKGTVKVYSSGQNGLWVIDMSSIMITESKKETSIIDWVWTISDRNIYDKLDSTFHSPKSRWTTFSPSLRFRRAESNLFGYDLCIINVTTSLVSLLYELSHKARPF